MNAVGIDVSEGKSMVAALRPTGEVALLPRELLHTEVVLSDEEAQLPRKAAKPAQVMEMDK